MGKKGKSFRRSLGFCVSGSPHLNPTNLVPFHCLLFFLLHIFSKHFFRVVFFFHFVVFFCCLCVTYLCEHLTLRFSPFGGNHLFAWTLDSDLLSGTLFSPFWGMATYPSRMVDGRGHLRLINLGDRWGRLKNWTFWRLCKWRTRFKGVAWIVINWFDGVITISNRSLKFKEFALVGNRKILKLIIINFINKNTYLCIIILMLLLFRMI